MAPPMEAPQGSGGPRGVGADGVRGANLTSVVLAAVAVADPPASEIVLLRASFPELNCSFSIAEAPIPGLSRPAGAMDAFVSGCSAGSTRALVFLRASEGFTTVAGRSLVVVLESSVYFLDPPGGLAFGFKPSCLFLGDGSLVVSVIAISETSDIGMNDGGEVLLFEGTGDLSNMTFKMTPLNLDGVKAVVAKTAEPVSARFWICAHFTEVNTTEEVEADGARNITERVSCFRGSRTVSALQVESEAAYQWNDTRHAVGLGLDCSAEFCVAWWFTLSDEQGQTSWSLFVAVQEAEAASFSSSKVEIPKAYTGAAGSLFEITKVAGQVVGDTLHLVFMTRVIIEVAQANLSSSYRKLGPASLFHWPVSLCSTVTFSGEFEGQLMLKFENIGVRSSAETNVTVDVSLAGHLISETTTLRGLPPGGTAQTTLSPEFYKLVRAYPGVPFWNVGTTVSDGAVGLPPASFAIQSALLFPPSPSGSQSDHSMSAMVSVSCEGYFDGNITARFVLQGPGINATLGLNTTRCSSAEADGTAMLQFHGNSLPGSMRPFQHFVVELVGVKATPYLVAVSLDADLGIEGVFISKAENATALLCLVPVSVSVFIVNNNPLFHEFNVTVRFTPVMVRTDTSGGSSLPEASIETVLPVVPAGNKIVLTRNLTFFHPAEYVIRVELLMARESRPIASGFHYAGHVVDPLKLALSSAEASSPDEVTTYVKIAFCNQVRRTFILSVDVTALDGSCNQSRFEHPLGPEECDFVFATLPCGLMSNDTIQVELESKHPAQAVKWSISLANASALVGLPLPFSGTTITSTPTATSTSTSTSSSTETQSPSPSRTFSQSFTATNSHTQTQTLSQASILPASAAEEVPSSHLPAFSASPPESLDELSSPPSSVSNGWVRIVTATAVAAVAALIIMAVAYLSVRKYHRGANPPLPGPDFHTIPAEL
eukprot:RCo036544